MAMSVEQVTVTGVSQYCIFAGSSRYGFNKGVDSTMFQRGHTYTLAVSTGTKGGKYISRIDADLGVVGGASAPSASVLNPSTNQFTAPVADTRPRRSKQGEPLTEYDLQTQERISRAGVIQAAVVACAQHSTGVEDLKGKAENLAKWMLEFTSGK